ncbi:MAG: type II toxin-antitoxin system Phd/YefM family antitoxin [Pseudomonadota bacterium]
MATVGSFEAKTHFSKLLDRVATGEKITITQHGEPVAILIPARTVSDKTTVRALLNEIRATRKGTRLADMTVEDLVNAGRNYGWCSTARLLCPRISKTRRPTSPKACSIGSPIRNCGCRRCGAWSSPTRFYSPNAAGASAPRAVRQILDQASRLPLAVDTQLVSLLDISARRRSVSTHHLRTPPTSSWRRAGHCPSQPSRRRS